MKKVCAHCGKKFNTPYPQYKYCSLKCRRKAYYLIYNKPRQKDDWEKRLLKKYSKDELVQCKICGKWFRQVGSHVWQIHGYTAREYREEYGFDVKRGQLPEDYREKKAKQAFECGGVKNLEQGKKFWFKKGDPRVGNYKRSEQTKERLQKQGKIMFKKMHEKRNRDTKRNNGVSLG